MRAKADNDGSDILLVDTGDKVEGNGLFDASDPKGEYTYGIFARQEIDIICPGNHELYKRNTSENEYLKTKPSFGSSYIASNVDILEPESGKRVPLAQRFRKFTTKNQGIRVLAFGFLFDFHGSSDHAFVQPVEDAIKEQWFQAAIRDRDVDVFVVAGHASVRSDEFKMIYNAIRDQQWDVPIQFFGGHYHVRDYKKFDNKAYGLASGRYMETFGFQSISGLPKSQDNDFSMHAAASLKFSRMYIDNNLYSLHHHSHTDAGSFPTDKGRNVSEAIASARKDMELDKKYGCAPQALWLNRVEYPGDGNSLFTWLEKQVVPDKVVDASRADKPRIIIGNTGAMRFDIFKGPFTRDTTYIVSPFMSDFHYIPEVPFSTASQLLTILNNGGQIFSAIDPSLSELAIPGPPEVHLKAPAPSRHTKDSIHQTWGDNMQRVIMLSDERDEEPRLIPGYTTVDDAGRDGDDTIHSPLQFYNVPNCFEVRVNTTRSESWTDAVDEHGGSLFSTITADKDDEAVDLVFLDFIQPWMLVALRFLGAQYTKEDVDQYAPGKDFTTMIAEWVQENWDGDC